MILYVVVCTLTWCFISFHDRPFSFFPVALDCCFENDFFHFALGCCFDFSQQWLLLIVYTKMRIIVGLQLSGNQREYACWPESIENVQIFLFACFICLFYFICMLYLLVLSMFNTKQVGWGEGGRGSHSEFV